MSRQRYQKSIIAAGHEDVCKAGSVVLEAGGNAFDAVVAAGFASTVVEPALTSLGGGGFMLGYGADQGQKMFFDFFVDTPGKGRKAGQLDPHFFPVTVNFSGASQVFNVGLGSVAVPGTLRGLLHIQKRLGRLSLAEVVEPARALACGHRLNAQQAHFLEILRPIMTLFPAGCAMFEPGGRYLSEGDCLVNPELAVYLEQLAEEGDQSFYSGDIAEAMVRDMDTRDGLLTRDDLAAYQVYEREPLRIPYGDAVLLTAPAPSMGGTLIGLSLALSQNAGRAQYDWGTAQHLLEVTARMQEVERLRGEGVTTPQAVNDFLTAGKSVTAATSGRLFSRGTTHISVADAAGNCASMTCSNGEGSGYFAPGTGIMLNNMMGEDDLHPEGFHTSPAGERVQSMMSPSMLLRKGEVQLVIGSGGSKRIRTAITQVISQVVDFKRNIHEAVEAPRLYWDEDCLQVEPGFSEQALGVLSEHEKVYVWQGRDVYFGGVHCVVPGVAGAGDPRRGGAVAEVLQK